MAQTIAPHTLDFLKKLAQHNDRNWFEANKTDYLKAQENMLAFTEEVLAKLNQHDHIETPSAKKSLMRIYRDTRFSTDKTPYKTHLGGRFARATKLLRGGYYFRVGPGVSRVAGGFYAPNNEDLLRIRKDIESNYDEWQKMLNNPKLKGTFGKLEGEKLTTAPKGFSKDHPAIELLRHKQFYFQRSFTDEEVLSAGFQEELNKSLENLRPFFDYMSEILTTDADGVPLY